MSKDSFLKAPSVMPTNTRNESTSNTHLQAVVSGKFKFNGVEVFEIFHRKYGYIFTTTSEMDLMSETESWVEFDLVKIQGGPLPLMAKNVFVVEGKKSESPATNEFRLDNRHDFNNKIRVDSFEYGEVPGPKVLTFKTWIHYKMNGPQGTGFYNDYYGKVNMARDDYGRLLQHGVRSLQAMLKLTPANEYKQGELHWTVIHFMHNSKTYNMNGFLSVIGLLGRGVGGRVTAKSEVRLRPDTLVLIRNDAENTSGTSSNNFQRAQRRQVFGRQIIENRQPIGLGALNGSFNRF